jgi:mono/diheme cytochrome c family protein
MKRALIVLALVVVCVIGAGLWFNYGGELGNESVAVPVSDAQATQTLIARGAYLAQAGNCAGCHTARGGEPYAGGRGIPTPFGTVYASNLTADAETGLGNWSSDDFWRALHNGRAKDGRLLYPAFPYTEYTKVTRADADALYAFFKTLAPVHKANRHDELRFPYNSQWALAAWRTLFFRPGVYQPRPEQSEQWNRGAYLVSGLGHCSGCHSARNMFGATSESEALSGGLIPMQGWYAPSLTSTRGAGVQHWQQAQVVALLKTGMSPHASVMGPMAEVVYRSTQHLQDGDLQAMAAYLQALPLNEPPAPAEDEIASIDADVLKRGKNIYGEHCADCHGARGEGVPNMYPPLAGNRSVLLDSSANTIRVVLNGGFAPATAGNPRPYGMPPFATSLTDDQVAVVVTYIRNAWGNRAPAAGAWEVGSYARGVGH